MLVSLIVLTEILAFNAVSNLTAGRFWVVRKYVLCLLLGSHRFIRNKCNLVWKFDQRLLPGPLCRLHQTSLDKDSPPHEKAVIPRNVDYKLVPGLPDKVCQKLIEKLSPLR